MRGSNLWHKLAELKLSFFWLVCACVLAKCVLQRPLFWEGFCLLCFLYFGVVCASLYWETWHVFSARSISYQWLHSIAKSRILKWLLHNIFNIEVTLTLSQPGGGGGHIVPPQVHFLKYLRNALSYGLEIFWQFKWIKLKNKNLFFNRLRPPLVTIATFKVDACFWKAHFGSFHAKAHQNSMFFATPTKNGRTVVCCENLG